MCCPLSLGEGRGEDYSGEEEMFLSFGLIQKKKKFKPPKLSLKIPPPPNPLPRTGSRSDLNLVENLLRAHSSR